MSTERLIKAAPKLLTAAKTAVRLLTRDPTTEDHAEAIELLNKAILAAEDQEWVVEFVTTPRTRELLYKFLSDAELETWLRGGERITSRRVYYRLPIEIVLANRLIAFLRSTNPGTATTRAFDRIADQVHREVSLPPLALLARFGL
jgi:hypothetical protein